ncbi:MAG: ChuX/HutX family heme-like substrate-binding protein, partial [Mangrovicoccus sp.]
GAWADVLAALAVEDQAQSQEQSLTVEPRAPTEPAKSRAENRDTLLSEWARMTDTHQFNRLCAKLGMNRLGAYRLVADTKWVTPMDVSAPAKMLEAVSLRGQEVILFVGNRGNIQIHWGKMEVITPMGPWLNVMDERFNLHLRGDHIAEVYVVEKPTKRGPAISLEAFDAEGGLIFQVFGRRAGQEDDNSSWHTLLSSLPLKLGVPA